MQDTTALDDLDAAIDEIHARYPVPSPEHQAITRLNGALVGALLQQRPITDVKQLLAEHRHNPELHRSMTEVVRLFVRFADLV